jgi:hypothetical protein
MDVTLITIDAGAQLTRTVPYEFAVKLLDAGYTQVTIIDPETDVILAQSGGN